MKSWLRHQEIAKSQHSRLPTVVAELQNDAQDVVRQVDGSERLSLTGRSAAAIGWHWALQRVARADSVSAMAFALMVAAVCWQEGWYT